MRNSKKNIQLLYDVSENLSDAMDSGIEVGDVAEALFTLWEQEKNLDTVEDLFSLAIDAEEVYRRLQDFDFNEFKQMVIIDARHYEDILLYEPELEFNVRWALAWRVNRFDDGVLNAIPHLYNAAHNIKLDIRTGACVRKGRFLKRIPLEVLVFIREEMEEVMEEELPSIYIN